MKAVVARLSPEFRGQVSVTEVDISTDPALESLYGLEIPVLLVDGKKVAKYRIDEGALRRILRDRAE